MPTLQQVLQDIASVADFAGVEITDPNTKGNFSTYPLHVVAVNGDCEAIRVLVEAGALIDQKGEHGFTPLMEAVAQGNDEAVELLISLGAQPIPNQAGDLPSTYASLAGNTALAARLRQRGY
jgi:uncharacterized protein